LQLSRHYARAKPGMVRSTTGSISISIPISISSSMAR
jgi:hypothetical protein